MFVTSILFHIVQLSDFAHKHLLPLEIIDLIKSINSENISEATIIMLTYKYRNYKAKNMYVN